ncbi:hypothetical protein JCM30566_11260 [Marinitoga arctica]
MKLNFLALQFNLLNSLEDNLEFIESIMDFVYHKKLSFFFINGNPFKNGSLTDEEYEQIEDFLSALADYNNCTIITAQIYQKKYQLFIQKPYEALKLANSFKFKLSDGKEIFLNDISNIDNSLNVIINPNFEIMNIENIKNNFLFLTQPLLGKTKLKIGEHLWSGGNTEGYLFFSW